MLNYKALYLFEAFVTRQ